MLGHTPGLYWRICWKIISPIFLAVRCFKLVAWTWVSQVWSLTQFYSVDFSQSRIGVNKCVFNKRTIKVCVSCCWRCPGTSAPSAPHLTVSLYLCSSGSNVRGELRALEGRHVSSKKPFKGPRRRQGSWWEERKRIVFPDEGSLICPPGKSMIFFYKTETQKNELVATPERYQDEDRRVEQPLTEAAKDFYHKYKEFRSSWQKL